MDTVSIQSKMTGYNSNAVNAVAVWISEIIGTNVQKMYKKKHRGFTFMSKPMPCALHIWKNTL